MSWLRSGLGLWRDGFEGTVAKELAAWIEPTARRLRFVTAIQHEHNLAPSMVAAFALLRCALLASAVQHCSEERVNKLADAFDTEALAILDQWEMRDEADAAVRMLSHLETVSLLWPEEPFEAHLSSGILGALNQLTGLKFQATAALRDVVSSEWVRATGALDDLLK